MPAPAHAGPPVSYLREQTIATNVPVSDFSEPVTSARLNAATYQQDALVSHNGYQYAAFYKNADGRTGVRHVALSRRQNSGPSPSAWESPLVLKGYEQTVNNGHNSISMGISRNDGTIHMAFDMMAFNPPDRFNYQRSVPNLTTSLAGRPWSEQSFNPVSHDLGGVPIVGDRVSYPRFISTPQGDLLLSLRLRASTGDYSSDEQLFEYRNGKWVALGSYLTGGGNKTIYVNGLDYRGNRLHVTWMWRGDNREVTNHDLMYAYSDDNGRTWKNTNGEPLGTTGSNPVRENGTHSPRVRVIPQGSGMTNQEGQAVDASGRVHVLLRDKLDGGVLRWAHHMRGVDGNWTKRYLPGVVPSQFRGKIVPVRNGSRDSVVALLPGVGIASASSAGGYRDWEIVDRRNASRFTGDPLYDRHWLAEGGPLSVFLQAGDKLMSQDWDPRK